MYVNVFMSLYLSFSLSSFSTHVPLPYLREWAGQEMFYVRKYLFNTKEGINEDTGEQKIHKPYWKT